MARTSRRCPPYRRPVNTVFLSYALFPHMRWRRTSASTRDAGQAPSRDRRPRLPDAEARAHGGTCQAQDQPDLWRPTAARRAGRALAPQPKVLLLDEPLSALDYKLRKDMQIELKRLQHETGITFIFVTHDQEEALTMSDRIAVMSKARSCRSAAARHLRPAVGTLRRQTHRETNFLEGTVESLHGKKRRSGAGRRHDQCRLPEGLSPPQDHHRGASEHADLVKAAKCRLKGKDREHRLFRTRHALHGYNRWRRQPSSCASRTRGAAASDLKSATRSA